MERHVIIYYSIETHSETSSYNLSLFYNQKLFLQFYNFKMLDIFALSFKFFSSEFFVYLFRAALCWLLLELSKVCLNR
jgi:hypothetical protein